jgi:hypothetical protein
MAKFLIDAFQSTTPKHPPDPPMDAANMREPG